MNYIEDFLKLLADTVLQGVQEHMNTVGSIAGIILVFVVLKRFDTNAGGNAIGRSAFLVEYSTVVLLLGNSMLHAKDLAEGAIDGMVATLNGVEPALLTASLATGSLGTATGMGTTFLLATTIVSNGIKAFFLPAACLLAAFSVVDNLSTELSISNLVDFIKKVVLWGLGLVMTVYLALLSVQGFLTTAEETAARKTAKFATGSLVPIVGQYLSDSFDAVASSASLIHSTTGTGAMIAILTLCLAPALELLLIAGLLQLTSALTQPVAEPRVNKCIGAVATAISLMAGLVAVCAAILTITIGAFLSVMGNVTGG